MSPHKKTTIKKPLKHQRYEEDCFWDRDAFETFLEFCKDAVIIVERKVDFGSLEGIFILDVFRDRTGSVDVHHILILEFFSNARMERDHLNYWVRGKELTISAMSIQNFL